MQHHMTTYLWLGLETLWPRFQALWFSLVGVSLSTTTGHTTRNIKIYTEQMLNTISVTCVDWTLVYATQGKFYPIWKPGKLEIVNGLLGHVPVSPIINSQIIVLRRNIKFMCIDIWRRNKWSWKLKCGHMRLKAEERTNEAKSQQDQWSWNLFRGRAT